MTQTIQLNRGLLVAVEGIDGTGKSTQVQHVAQKLTAAGLSTVTTREPTHGPHGQRLRASATTGRLSPEEELSLFLLDRAEHAQTLILPALQRGQIVLTDRYYFSTLAYQGSRGLDLKTLRDQNEAIAPKPDLLIVLTLPITTALTRIQQQRGTAPDLFESAAQLTACQAIFLSEVQTFQPSQVIDAQASPDAITAQILRALLTLTPLPDLLRAAGALGALTALSA